jgi:putative transcription factor
MAKKISSQFDKECQICGGAIWGKGFKVLLEGATITVCQSCAQNGTIVQNRNNTFHQNKRVYSKPSQTPKTQRFKSREFENLEIIADYDKIISNIRNKQGLNQDQFAQKLNEKPSLMKRIESGKVEPTIQLAKKIESVYGIKLTKEIDAVEASFSDSKYLKKTSGSSLGDIAFIRKKRK